MSNFIQNCLTGDASLDDIDDHIDKWHDGDSELLLHTYLGMNRDEYAAWVESPDTLTHIVAAHKRGISYKDAIAQAAGFDKSVERAEG